MSDERVGPDRELEADLAALRSALRQVHAPADGEHALRAALRARGAEVSPLRKPARDGAATQRRRGAWSAPLALAAAAALVAVAALLTLRADRGATPLSERDAALQRAAASTSSAASTASPGASSRAAANAFHPLAFSPALSPSQSYAVVRVRIPLSALAPGHTAAPDASIDADVLVGDDGLAAGIRFDSADTLYVSTVSN